jgi:phosphatidate cytidylyltransferase
MTAAVLDLPSAVLVVLGGIWTLLLAAALVVWRLRRRHGWDAHHELPSRVRAWWWIIGFFSLALIAGRTGAVWLFGLVSYLAFKEYVSLIPTRRADRRVLFWAYLSIPLQYYWTGIGWYGMFIIFIPVYVALFLPMRMVLLGATDGFIRAVGTILWGLMTTVFGLSHAAYLLVLPAEVAPAGGAGLLLFLVLLTQANDIAQYLWGKTLGGAKCVPAVSPGKTWSGLLGGVATTTALAMLLGPWLTPLAGWTLAAAGVLIGVFGFVGDLTVSAIKRDLGIKDTGCMLPGHGGILDRVDSLTYSAPLFFHFLYYLHY